MLNLSIPLYNGINWLLINKNDADIVNIAFKLSVYSFGGMKVAITDIIKKSLITHT
ncbi:hypothetical protein MZ16F84_40220 [Escherichia coli]